MNNKPLNDIALLAQAKKIGREKEYQEFREKLLTMMENALEEGQEDYAAFLFAFSSVANEVQRRRTKPKRH